MLRAAICHVSPVFLNAVETTQKAVRLVKQAASNSANLVVFPETYIPAFPIWSALQAPHQNHDFFYRMVKESIYADGEEIRAIRDAAKQSRLLVSVGFSEKSRHSTATLYNSNLLIDINGTILIHHRKLMPTFFEKLTWSPGDGHGLRVSETAFGKIGALICGENTNPLARYALMAQSEQVHISTWPAVWPTRFKSASEAGEDVTEIPASIDKTRSPSTQGQNYDNVAANRIRGAAHCFEAKCFGILSAGLLDGDCINTIATDCSEPTVAKALLESAPQAPSMFLDPNGTLLQGFTIDQQSGARVQKDFLQHESDILYADMNLEQCIEGKQYHDVSGGYQRLDVFNLEVNRTRRDPVTFLN